MQRSGTHHLPIPILLLWVITALQLSAFNDFYDCHDAEFMVIREITQIMVHTITQHCTKRRKKWKRE